MSAAWGRVVLSVTSCPNPNTDPLLAVYTIFAVPLLTATRPLQRPLKGTCAVWRPAACPVKYCRGGLVYHIRAQNDLAVTLHVLSFGLSRDTGYPNWSFILFLSPSRQMSDHNSISLRLLPSELIAGQQSSHYMTLHRY